MAQGGWFAYDQGGDAAHFGSFRLYRLRPFHTVQLNAVGWAVLLCAALPMVMLLLFVARWSAWLSIVASVVVTVAGAIVLDRPRKQPRGWAAVQTSTRPSFKQWWPSCKRSVSVSNSPGIFHTTAQRAGARPSWSSDIAIPRWCSTRAIRGFHGIDWCAA